MILRDTLAKYGRSPGPEVKCNRDCRSEGIRIYSYHHYDVGYYTMRIHTCYVVYVYICEGDEERDRERYALINMI